ncbi:DUF3307 domain-containing protein [Aestuariibacter halophilus]|uniref:DUF3307 domain-containing protein n=1 Tax=Fluctibacter halophilus TaxID=226011 RepID=A0ABS8G653_9ALTE|nr:DUF3307 domain-containing protein [Aestuariibacter halophilus]MCC2615988.1 DUF3307 domain-containing protein [Aestuariibacter halophilus]
MTDSVLLTGLILSHIIADFYLQPRSWIASRNTRHFRSPALVWHAGVHAALASVWLISYEVIQFGWDDVFPALVLALLIGVTHYVTDVIKSYLPDQTRYFLLDQAAHLLIILLVWLDFTQNYATLGAILADGLSVKTLVLLIAYLLILRPCAVMITLLLRQWDPQFSNDAETPYSLMAAGEHIGYLERVLVLTFLFTQQYAGIGFLLAAKSIFRFGDLRSKNDRKLTEYVMYGTLLSMVLTVMIGFTAMLLSGLPIR